MPIFKFWRALTAPGRRGSAKDRAAHRLQGGPRPVEPRSYAAVGIRVGAVACKSARALAGKRFLVAEAPSLPLQSCNVHCKCTYRSYDDRRQEPRRSADVGVSSRFYVGSERRSGLDRRLSHRLGGDDDYFGFMRQRD
jgi:hypothetical protein